MIKCPICKNNIKLEFKNIQKKRDSRIIAIKNIPGYNCSRCKKIFCKYESVNVLKFVMSSYFTDKRVLLLYDTVLQQYLNNAKLLGRDIDKEKEKRLSNIDIFNDENTGKKPNKPLKLKNLIFTGTSEDKIKEKVEMEEGTDKEEIVYSGAYYEGYKATETLLSIEFEKNQIVMLYHHSGISPFKSIVIDSNSNTCLVKVLREFALMSFSEEDPAVLKFSQKDVVYIIGCIVTNINKRNMTAILNIDKIEKSDNQRRSERIPVSLYTEIHLPNNSQRCSGIIKNMSLHGALIYTKCELIESNRYEFDLHTNDRILYVCATVVRTQKGSNYNGYGIEFFGVDEDTKCLLEEFLKNL